MQTQPVVVDGVLYGYTPTHKAFAIRADTGAPLWTFDSGIRGSGANRGVMYWAAGSNRRIFAAVDNFIYGLDARPGSRSPRSQTTGASICAMGSTATPQLKACASRLQARSTGT